MTIRDIGDALRVLSQLEQGILNQVRLGRVVVQASPGYETSWIGMYMGEAVMVTVKVGKEQLEEGGRTLSGAVSSMKGTLLAKLSERLQNRPC